MDIEVASDILKKEIAKQSKKRKRELEEEARK